MSDNLIQLFTDQQRKLEARFPDYIVSSGLAKYEHQTAVTVFITLKPKQPAANLFCECCHQKVQTSKPIETYAHETYESAIAAIEEILNDLNNSKEPQDANGQ